MDACNPRKNAALWRCDTCGKPGRAPGACPGIRCTGRLVLRRTVPEDVQPTITTHNLSLPLLSMLVGATHPAPVMVSDCYGLRLRTGEPVAWVHVVSGREQHRLCSFAHARGELWHVVPAVCDWPEINAAVVAVLRIPLSVYSTIVKRESIALRQNRRAWHNEPVEKVRP